MILRPAALSGRNDPTGGSARQRMGSGFTLLEVVIVMVIIAVLAGLALPVVSSMMREAEMREPVERLQELAKSTRLRSMLEGYPYEIIFTAEGFEGRRFQIRGEGEEEGQEEDGNREEKDEEEAKPEEEGEGESDEEKKPELKLPELEAYQLPGDMTARLLFWGRTRWSEPLPETQKEQTPVHDRWVFQPTGVCNPLRVQFLRGTAWVEMTFNPLTADIQSERLFLPD